MTTRAELFSFLGSEATAPKFFEHVSDIVEWTVMGTHPLAGLYRSKQAFFDATFAVLPGLMRDGLTLHVERFHDAGDYGIVELRADATTLEGVPFDNRYCWVCRFDDDLIVEVRAYLDSAMVAYAVGRGHATTSR